MSTRIARWFFVITQILLPDKKTSLNLINILLKRVFRYGKCLILIAMITLPAFAASMEVIKLRAVTSSFPPLQMLENGRPDGYAVALVDMLVRRVSQRIEQSIEFQFEFLPWNRALRTASSAEQNILFFSLSRSPAREDKFHWLGEISPYDLHLYTLDPNLPTDLPTLDAIRDSDKIIGVQDGSSVIEYLLSLGFILDKDFITVADYHESIKMLYRHRIDYVTMTSFLARGNVCSVDLNPDQLVQALRIKPVSQPLWLVFSRSTNPELVHHFTETLDSFNMSNQFQHITQSEIKRWADRLCGSRS